MIIEANTPCFLSTIQKNNFWSPRKEGLTYIINEIRDPSFKSWVCDNPRLRALLVTPDNLRDVFGNPNTMVVVWVHENNLKSA